MGVSERVEAEDERKGVPTILNRTEISIPLFLVC